MALVYLEGRHAFSGFLMAVDKHDRRRRPAINSGSWEERRPHFQGSGSVSQILHVPYSYIYITYSLWLALVTKS